MASASDLKGYFRRIGAGQRVIEEAPFRNAFSVSLIFFINDPFRLIRARLVCLMLSVVARRANNRRPMHLHRIKLLSLDVAAERANPLDYFVSIHNLKRVVVYRRDAHPRA
jgi:hypothetical protein